MGLPSSRFCAGEQPPNRDAARRVCIVHQHERIHSSMLHTCTSKKEVWTVVSNLLELCLRFITLSMLEPWQPPCAYATVCFITIISNVRLPAIPCIPFLSPPYSPRLITSPAPPPPTP